MSKQIIDKAEDNQELCRLLNTVAPGYLAAAVEKRGGWLIQISTDYVFQGDGCIPYTEDQPTSPLGAYGRTKLAGEKAVAERMEAERLEEEARAAMEAEGGEQTENSVDDDQAFPS